jgi:acetylornithine deacetylase
MNLSNLDTHIRTTAQAWQSAHLALLRELIAMPSPAGSERAIQLHVAAKLQQLGAEVDVFEADLARLQDHPEFAHHPDELSTNGRPNVVGRVRGAGDGPSLLLYAHPDTEALTTSQVWNFDPLAGLIQAGRLYGLGAADDKAGLAALLAVGQLLQATSIQLKGDLILVSCIGKRGGAAGTLAVMERGYRADAVIYAHPAETGQGYQHLKTLSRGVLPFSLRVPGYRPPPLEIGTPHSALPHQGVSAIQKGAYLLNHLAEWDTQRAGRLYHPLLNEQLGRATTLTIGEIHSSPGPARAPIWCELRGLLTFGPGETLASVQADLAQAIHNAAAQDEWLAQNPPHLRFEGPRANPAQTDPDQPLVGLVQETISEVTGISPQPYAGHLQSDIRFPILYGMPTVGFGPTAGNFYGPDEWVEIEGFLELIVILAQLSLRWCGATNVHERGARHRHLPHRRCG